MVMVIKHSGSDVDPMVLLNQFINIFDHLIQSMDQKMNRWINKINSTLTLIVEDAWIEWRFDSWISFIHHKTMCCPTSIEIESSNMHSTQTAYPFLKVSWASSLIYHLFVQDCLLLTKFSISFVILFFLLIRPLKHWKWICVTLAFYYVKKKLLRTEMWKDTNGPSLVHLKSDQLRKEWVIRFN